MSMCRIAQLWTLRRPVELRHHTSAAHVMHTEVQRHVVSEVDVGIHDCGLLHLPIRVRVTDIERFTRLRCVKLLF